MEENKLIEERIENSPPEIKKILTEGSWANIVNELAQKNSLSIEETTSLENEVLFVLLGMELLDDFVTNLNLEGIDKSVATYLSEELKERIFREVESLLPTEVEGVASVPEIAQEIHPNTIQGEAAHDTTQEEKELMNMENIQTTTDSQQSVAEEPKTPQPQQAENKPANKPDTPKPQATSYAQGKDPYREPIE